MRRLLAAALVCVSVAACSSGGSPKADLQTRMNAVVDAANAKDASQLRGALADFLREVTRQSQNGDITSTKTQDLETVANRLLKNASLLEQTTPSPAASSAAPSPSPTQAPPSPSPTQAPPSPSPTQAPPSPSPIASLGVSSSPAPLVQSSS